MTNAAQEEFNELMRDKDHEERHPEDRNNDSDLSDPESEGAEKDRYEIVDTDDELDLPADMRSNYYMPSHIRSEANTGPKGVIADAQAFEQAKKQARRFTWKKSASPQQYNVTAYQDERLSSDEENDGGFMKQWRESRLRELQNAGQRIRSRTNSPSRRIYGSMPAVDGEGYLDAIEKTPSDTVVVVFIYNDLVRLNSLNCYIPRLIHHSPRSPTWLRSACAKSRSATTQSASSSCTTMMRRWKRKACQPFLLTEAATSSPASCLFLTNCLTTRSSALSPSRQHSEGQSHLQSRHLCRGP